MPIVQWNVYRWHKAPPHSRGWAEQVATVQARHAPDAILQAMKNVAGLHGLMLIARPASDDPYAKAKAKTKRRTKSNEQERTPI